eukprot:12920084-Alexandrium_andersonii.AAC.1
MVQGGVSIASLGSPSNLERSRSRLGAQSGALVGGATTPIRGISPTSTMQQKEQLAKRLQDELVAEVVQASHVANGHLEELV